MADDADLALQRRLLAGVSRSFAFTIPQLPGGLRRAAGNGYLLCRIADTIEDDPGLTLGQRQEFFARLAVLADGGADAQFGSELAAALSSQSRAADRELAACAEAVLRVNRALPAASRRALARCVGRMSCGMAEFAALRGRAGLADVEQLERYCHVVAGVFGEMLTELFCAHDLRIDALRERLMPLADSFGRGLQLTNVLKDLHEDRSRGVCWLPRDIFLAEGVELEGMPAGQGEPGFARALDSLLGIARGHLEDALRYVLLLPATQTGLRRYCLWATGMALLTLRRIDANPGFSSEREVRISRAQVRSIVAATSATAWCNPALAALFAWLCRGLPGGKETATRLDS